MPQFAYSFKAFDPAIHVRASGREVNISPKAAREICNTIRLMTLTKAIALLENVEEMKSPIPFRRHKLKVGHRSELVGFPSGSYPVKPAKASSRYYATCRRTASSRDWTPTEFA